jgi:hypothetical protein
MGLMPHPRPRVWVRARVRVRGTGVAIVKDHLGHVILQGKEVGDRQRLRVRVRVRVRERVRETGRTEVEGEGAVFEAGCPRAYFRPTAVAAHLVTCLVVAGSQLSAG